jgi:hypothetical protein
VAALRIVPTIIRVGLLGTKLAGFPFVRPERTLVPVATNVATGLYYSGKRTREWLKFKAVHEKEVVTVGYTGPRGAQIFRRVGAHRTRQSEKAMGSTPGTWALASPQQS